MHTSVPTHVLGYFSLKPWLPFKGVNLEIESKEDLKLTLVFEGYENKWLQSLITV